MEHYSYCSPHHRQNFILNALPSEHTRSKFFETFPKINERPYKLHFLDSHSLRPDGFRSMPCRRQILWFLCLGHFRFFRLFLDFLRVCFVSFRLSWSFESLLGRGLWGHEIAVLSVIIVAVKAAKNIRCVLGHVPVFCLSIAWTSMRSLF